MLLRNDDNDLTQTAIETFIEKPLEFGWDKENMGIFYFLDADGKQINSCHKVVCLQLFRSQSHSP